MADLNNSLPGIYTEEVEGPRLNTTVGGNAVVAFVGPAIGFRTATQQITLEGVTAVPLNNAGVIADSYTVTSASSGVQFVNEQDYTVVQGADQKATIARKLLRSTTTKNTVTEKQYTYFSAQPSFSILFDGENNPIVEKSQFIMSLVEQIDKAGVGPQQKSIIDRCTALVYPEAEKEGRAATLCDLRNKLLEQPEEKAKEIALSLELYTTGSLDIFGRDSTVDLNKPYVVFDIHGLGEQLKPAGSLVITDTILNRVTLNWKRGKRTHVFIDEFHVMFENEQSGIFFNSAWRQFRKRGAYPTAITQNVEYLLDSVQASTMLSNSEFIVMLNQAASDRAKLAKLLNISNEQMSYVTNADAGCGLIRYGSALVPFINRFPRDTKLYALMTTKPGEGVFGGEEVPA